MTWTEIFNFSAAVLASLGGGAAIIFGFSNWLGKVWAGRILESEKAALQKETESFKKEIQKEIEHEKANLQRQIEHAKAQYQLETEKNKAKFLRYSETQFRLYNELWASLCELETACEALWENAALEKLLQLKKDLIKAKKAVKNGYLLIEDDHYNQLNNIIGQFEEFEFGKSRLLRLRSNDPNNEFITHHEIRSVIDQNGAVRQQYSDLLVQVGGTLKRQIAA